MTRRNILIIGGTGVFGKRLVRHLATQSGIALHVSSRSAAKAAAFVETLAGSQAALYPVELDCQTNLKARLSEIRPFIVVDCSGPFQGAHFNTARLVLKAGAHFIDLADARDYLADFSAKLNATAREHGVCAFTGASSTPTLSTCVVQLLTSGWQRIDTIDMCIRPGGKGDVGRSVIKAIMSYAGKDIPIWTAGQMSLTTGWQGAKMVDVPGLGRCRVAAVETYDAEYLGPRLSVQSRVSFSAGLESRIEQFGIEAIAALRKFGFLKSTNFLVPSLLQMRKITRIPTSSVGGMHVEVCGLDANGTATQSQWSLIARQNHGPFIPILPAAAVIQKLMSEVIEPGARIAHSAVTLPDILREMRAYDIQTETASSQMACGIFEQALGAEVFAALPSGLSRLHQPDGPVVWSGKADIDRGFGRLSKAIAWFFGFPKSGQDVPVTVSIDRKKAANGSPTEIWGRTFAGTPMISTLRCAGADMISERFWPFTFALKLGTQAKRIEMPVLNWRIGKLQLPRSLAPHSETSEFIDEYGRFCFDVKISAAWVGPLAHYRGWLEPNQKNRND